MKAFEVDEAHKRIKILVSEDQLSLAIGKRGQNARLTSKLTGWHVDIVQEQVIRMGFEEKVAEAVHTLAAIPGISEDQANILVHAGFSNFADLLQAEIGDLAEMPLIGDQAATIVEAVRGEAARRSLKLGEASVA